MHIHKILFVLFAAFLGASFALIQGCGNSHGVMPMADAGPVIGDSGPVLTDAGPIVSDSGPIPVDAGPAPTVSIVAYGMPADGIVVAGNEVWHEVGEIRIGIDQELASICLELDGDPADIADLALAEFGRISHVNYILGTRLGGFGGDAERNVLIWARIPDVVSNATSGGAHDGFPMSGDRFRVGITGADRMIDGVRTHVDIDALWGPTLQIRKSVPMIARQALSSTTLTSGLDMDLYRSQVSADSAGPIALHAIAYDITSARPTSVTLSDFRVRRGSTDLGPAAVRVIDEVGADLGTGTLDFTSSSTRRVYVVFDDEQTIAGSGSVYTLHALVGGTVVAGDAITVAFRRTGFGETGYLMDDGLAGAIDTSPWGSPLTVTPWLVGGLIWSDLSEVPHSGAAGSDGGSRDWTDDRFINDLTQLSTLTR
jgi:hypothetical protein